MVLYTLEAGLHALLPEEPAAATCNSYLLTGSKIVLIDPGARQSLGRLRTELNALGLTVEDLDLLLVTHWHPDHLEAAAELSGQAMLAMGRTELEILSEAGSSLPAPDFLLTGGSLHIGDLYLDVFKTPGHTPGHLCFYWPRLRALFSGDLLFKDAVGRCDLPGGSERQLRASLQGLKSLDLEYVLPGHGPIVAGKEAVEDNLRMAESAVPAR